MKRLAARLAARLATASGWTRRARIRRRAQGDFRVYILAYHDVTRGAEREGVVSAERLARQLRFLQTTYRVAGLSEAAGRLQQRLDQDLLVLTFDDGYRDNHRVAWPVLREAGAVATIFLTTGFLDGEELWFDFARRALGALDRHPELLDEAARRALAAPEVDWRPGQPIEPVARRLKLLHPDRRREMLDAVRALDLELPPASRPMSWDEARELRDAGLELGGHTVHHPILSTLSAAEQEEEIRLCRDRIAAELGSPPRTFAIPNGSPRDYDEHTLEALRRCEFTTCCTMIRGSNPAGVDPLQLRRIGVGHDPNFLLEARLAGLFDQEMRQRWRL